MLVIMAEGSLRLVKLNGKDALAWDFAERPDGTHLAITGAGAVQCPRCSAYQGKRCQTPDEKPLDFNHLERTHLMKMEIAALLTPPREASDDS